MKDKKEKIVLAFSGGLDTSVILKWLQIDGGWDVVTFTADVGQGGEVERAREKALLLGVAPENIHIADLRSEFADDYVSPVFRANAVYEGNYLMGTPIARPLIAKKQIELANSIGAKAVSHGATGKGNDQIRFELTYYALNPNIHVIAPWRTWNFQGRADLIDFARRHQIPVDTDSAGVAKYSSDANLLHVTAEGRELEDPWVTPNREAFSWVVDPEDAQQSSETITLSFLKGDPVSLNGCEMSRVELLESLNEIGARHGVGRIDIVDTRYIGIKSRGLFETPGGTIWNVAHRAIESITLDRGESHLKDELMPRYAELVYNGYWHAPERLLLQTLIDESQKYVTGEVRLRIYRGNVIVEGRRSPYSLYDSEISSFENGAPFNSNDANGFIALNALRLKMLFERRKENRGK